MEVGGTLTESKPEFQRKPLTFPVVKARSWLIANILGTLAVSQAVAEGNEPTHLFQGPGADKILLDLSEPGGRIDIPTNLIQYVKQRRDGVDPGLQGLLDRYEGEIKAATLPSVLVTAEALPGESFSGYNLRVQTAIGALMPYKRLDERWHENLFEKMLLYGHYTGKGLTGWGKELKELHIKASDIDPMALMIDVELTPDVPIDRLQKIAAAERLVTTLNYSPKRAMQFLGENDPQGAMDDFIQWKFIEAKLLGKLERIKITESGQLNAMAAEMAQEMLENMAAQEGEQNRLPAPPPADQAIPEEPLIRGSENGSGLEATIDGIAPIEELGEGATFEGVRGGDRGNPEEIA
jgi:hypothetical protein